MEEGTGNEIKSGRLINRSVPFPLIWVNGLFVDTAIVDRLAATKPPWALPVPMIAGAHESSAYTVNSV